MPFTRGMKRPEGAGRKKGQPNRVVKVTVHRNMSMMLAKDVASRLEELGCDPVTGLALMALNPKVEDGIRRLCFADLMKYVYPQRRSVEFSGQINTVGVTIDGSSALRALEDRILGIRERLGAVAQRSLDTDGNPS